MRKFFVTVALLLILGGAGFFFGWAQLAVPPGTWGVMRSKTHGLDRNLIREGELRWVWYKLIPTNVEILVFSPERVSRSVFWQGELPSANTYAALAGLNGDFSWEIRAELSFGIKPSSLPSLVEERNIGNQEELRQFAAALADEIQIFAQGRLLASAERAAAAGEFFLTPGQSSSSGEPGLPADLAAEIYRTFPDIENLSCSVRPVRFPDFALYHSARGIYEEYLQKQRDFLSKDLGRAAESRLSSRFRFDELERYGELLTKYPILLRYLALEAGWDEFVLSGGEAGEN
jgi:hypothetical protein